MILAMGTLDSPPGPYNEITSVKSLADMVGEEGDKSGIFEATMTTISLGPRKKWVQETGAAQTRSGAFEIWKKGTLKNIWMAGLGRDDHD